VTSIEKPSRLLNFTYLSFPGKSIFFKALFWIFIAATLLFGNIEACIFKPTLLTSLLSFLVPIGVFLSIRYKTFGLILSYIALAVLFLMFSEKVSNSDRMWQLTLGFVTAVDFFIVLLIREEAALLFQEIDSNSIALKEEVVSKESAILVAKRDQEAERKELEEQIEKLKEEAEQRRLEKQQYERKFELIQSEIDLLNNQKEKFIQKAQEASVLSEKVLKKNDELTQEMEAMKRSFEIENEEKEKIIVSTRSLSHELETMRASWSKENEEKERLLISRKGVSQELEESKNSLRKVIEEKENLLGFATGQTVKLQEQILSFLSRKKMQEPSDISQTTTQSDKLYKQLRLQFEEKSRMLNETRKELFQTQTKLLAHEKEKVEEELNAKGDVRSFEAEISLLISKTAELEEEVTALEELISHILLP